MDFYLLKSLDLKEKNKLEFVETVVVNEGVTCDVYSFPADPTKDLGIIKIKPAHTTPLQRILAGERTIEGHISGNGMLTVIREGKHKNVFIVKDVYLGKLNVDVNIGDLMQWQAAADSNLVVYEICYPPYKDGRFENLPNRIISSNKAQQGLQIGLELDFGNKSE